MTIARIKKITLIGLSREKRLILGHLQELGCMHLNPLREESGVDYLQPGLTVIEEAYEALKYLHGCPRKRHQVLSEAGFELAKCVEEILKNRRHIRYVTDLRDFLAQRITDLEPWGDFKLSPIDALAGYRLWFYRAPAALIEQLPRTDLIWQMVRRDPRFAYVVVIAKDEPPVEAMPAPRVHTGSVPISELRLRLNDIELELEDLVAEREALTRWIYLISRNLARAEDADAMAKAGAMALDCGELFAVQGWIPEDRLGRIEEFAVAGGLALIAEEPKPDENPPTLLVQRLATAAGGDLVQFYQMPGYRSWDPAPTVFFSFTLFFAMILSDAGYGLLLLTLLLPYWKRLGQTERGKRMRTLAACLISATVIWGVIVGSYLGFSPPANGLLAKLKLLDVNQFDAMMELSVLVGVLHLAMALANDAMVRWKRGGVLVPVGWLAAMLGAVVWWLAQTHFGPYAELLRTGALGIAVLGAALVFLGGGRRPVRGYRDLLIRVLEGLAALTNVTRLFGDVLSYLRLFALGLASASLALTFNGLAQQAVQSESGLGLLFG
ncbi:MAG: hypothetical protein ABFS02_11790, partial [Pseudomonadota bacterium]